jgi:hypothetical protein
LIQAEEQATAESSGPFDSLSDILPKREDIQKYWDSRTTLQKYCIVAPQLIALALAIVSYLAVTQDGQTPETCGHDAYINGPNRDPKVNGHNRAVMYPGEENKKFGENTTDFLS